MDIPYDKISRLRFYSTRRRILGDLRFLFGVCKNVVDFTPSSYQNLIIFSIRLYRWSIADKRGKLHLMNYSEEAIFGWSHENFLLVRYLVFTIIILYQLTCISGEKFLEYSIHFHQKCYLPHLCARSSWNDFN